MLTRTERLDLSPAINQAGEVEREARLAHAKAWLCKRWSQEHPNERHIIQLADYAAALATQPATSQEIAWRGTDEEQYEARVNACCSRRTQWPAQDCPRDGSCDDCWQDMAEALKVSTPLPDGLVHPDDCAREYQDSVKAKAVCVYCNGTGFQLSGFSQKPSDRMCLACDKDDPDHAYWQSCKHLQS